MMYNSRKLMLSVYTSFMFIIPPNRIDVPTFVIVGAHNSSPSLLRRLKVPNDAPSWAKIDMEETTYRKIPAGCGSVYLPHSRS